MHVRRLIALIAVPCVALLVSCSTSNPSRPSVSFGTPVAEAPGNGTSYGFGEQPITLTIVNAPRTGSATVVYRVEVSTSASFDSTVFARDDVPEDPGGVTRVTLPMLEGGRTYHWRSRAAIDGVAGTTSEVSRFDVRPNVVFSAPVPVAPTGGDAVFTERPTFRLQNASRTGEPGVVSYEFQVSSSSSFATILASATIVEQPSQTSWTPTVDLPLGELFWRARAADPTNDVTGDYSGAAAFDRRPSTGDQLDLSTVTIVLGPSNIGSWPATARVTSTVAQNGLICIDHTALGAWPGTIFFDDPAALVQGNQWMFAFIGGKWYGGSGRWYRPGQACKETEATDGFGGTFYMDAAEPLRSYVPQPGDTIGLMSTTPNRFYPSMATVDERTNVVLVKWGG